VAVLCQGGPSDPRELVLCEIQWVIHANVSIPQDYGATESNNDIQNRCKARHLLNATKWNCLASPTLAHGVKNWCLASGGTILGRVQ